MYSVKTHRYEVIHPRFRSLNPRLIEQPGPDVSGLDWIGEVDGSQVYADQSLIDEINALEQRGWPANSYFFHATGSSALAGIAKYQALLSAKALTARGEPISTGEYVTEMGEYPRAKGGLEDVYVSRDPTNPRDGLATTDDYPVIFGITRQALAHVPPYLQRDSGDGIRAGAEIHLSHVTSVTVPYAELPEAQEWSTANCDPGTLTLSWDAASVIRYLSRRW